MRTYAFRFTRMRETECTLWEGPISTYPDSTHLLTSPSAYSFSTGPPIRKFYFKLANRRCGLSEPLY